MKDPKKVTPKEQPKTEAPKKKTELDDKDLAHVSGGAGGSSAPLKSPWKQKI